MALMSWSKRSVNGNGHGKPTTLDVEIDELEEAKKERNYFKNRAELYEHTIEALNAQLEDAKAEINRLNSLILKNMEFLHGTVEKLVMAKIPQGESPKAVVSPALQAYLDKKKTDTGPAKKLP